MAGFNDLAYYFQQYGVLDFLLPFLLVYTISFAILHKAEILGKGETGKKYHAIVALVLGMSFVVPHVMGIYPLGYDPVQVLNESLPSISLVSVAAIMLLLLLGIFGRGFTQAAGPFIALFSIGFILYIFGAALRVWNGPWDIFYWWDTQTTELMVVIVVFALVVYFITSDPKPAGQRNALGNMWDEFKKMIN